MFNNKVLTTRKSLMNFENYIIKKKKNGPIVATVSSIGPPNIFDWTKIKMIIYRTKRNYELIHK